jgi:hypothetical protein
MFEDFKAQVAEKHDRQVAENFLATAQPLKKGHKSFIYQNDQVLTNQITSLYPDSTHLTIINNDIRDCEGAPTVKTLNLRKRFTGITYTQGKQILNRVNWEVYQNVICIIDNSQVRVKIINSNYNNQNRGFY